MTICIFAVAAVAAVVATYKLTLAGLDLQPSGRLPRMSMLAKPPPASFGPSGRSAPALGQASPQSLNATSELSSSALPAQSSGAAEMEVHINGEPRSGTGFFRKEVWRLVKDEAPQGCSFTVQRNEKKVAECPGHSLSVIFGRAARRHSIGGTAWHRNGIELNRPPKVTQRELVEEALQYRASSTDRVRWLVLLRDPRAVALSSYYYLQGAKNITEDRDSWVRQHVATICEHTNLRWRFFKELNRQTKPEPRAAFFFYERLLAKGTQEMQRAAAFLGLAGAARKLAAVPGYERKKACSWRGLKKATVLALDEAVKRVLLPELRAEFAACG